MRRTILHSAAFAILWSAISASSAAPSADELLGKAREKAAKDNKSIFVDFSASW